MHGFLAPGSVPYVLSSPRDHRLGPATRPQPRPQSVSVTTPMEAARPGVQASAGGTVLA